MPDLIESFEAKKGRIIEELAVLKKEIEEHKTFSAETPEDGKEAEHFKKLQEKAKALQKRLDENVERWRNVFGPGTKAHEGINKFFASASEDLKAILEPEAGSEIEKINRGRAALEALDKRTKEAQEVADDDTDTLKEAILKEKAPVVGDLIPDIGEVMEEAEEEGGWMGGITKMVEMLKPIMKMVASLNIKLKEFMLTFKNDAEAKKELNDLKEAYEMNYGVEDWRAMFASEAQKLPVRLTVQEGAQDTAAVEKLITKHGMCHKNEAQRRAYVRALLKEYVKDNYAAGPALDALQKRGQKITMLGVLEAQRALDPLEGKADNKDLVDGSEEVEPNPGEKYTVKVAEDTIEINKGSEETKRWKMSGTVLGPRGLNFGSFSLKVPSAYWIPSEQKIFFSIDYQYELNDAGKAASTAAGIFSFGAKKIPTRGEGRATHEVDGVNAQELLAQLCSDEEEIKRPAKTPEGRDIEIVFSRVRT